MEKLGIMPIFLHLETDADQTITVRINAGRMKYSVDDIGDVYGVCLGSGCAKTAEYYMGLQTKKNDDHGTGIILWTAAELIRLQKTS